jgi:hypothetical protein
MTPKTPFTFTAQPNRNLIRVGLNGVFAGWLTRSTRRTTGLHAQRIDTWEGKIAGTEIRATTLTGAKKQIAALEG